MHNSYLVRRPRRNRQSVAIRGLVQETHLMPSCLVAPLFVQEGENKKTLANTVAIDFQETSEMAGEVELELRQAIKDDPDNPLLYETLSDLLKAEGCLHMAARVLLEFIVRHPDNLEMHAKYGDIEQRIRAERASW